ncbi:MAG: shikimate dehydrogenase family protein [Gemmatimonadaceae bacterium]
MIERGRVALIGHPVSHSLSPAMQNAALDAAGIALRYEALDVDPAGLAAALEAMKNVNGAGNLTIPHKVKGLALMQKLTSTAARAGAVNTFWVDDDGELAGDNTDVGAFTELVRETLGAIPSDARVAVLGAGGAAAAVVTALETWPNATATVHARDLSRAVVLRMRHSVVVRACSMRDPCLSDATIVVNATPLGLAAADPLPVELERLNPGAVVLDLVYGPGGTKLVTEARESGHVASDGLPMLLHQGAAAFHRWFGVDADLTAMRDVLKTQSAFRDAESQTQTE